MASRRTIRAKEAQLAFEALSIEGGLLSPEWLSKVAQLSAGLQTEADYRIPKGLNVRDEIGRYWRIAQAHWKDFAAGSAAKADSAAVAERFLTALLKESFGFESLVKVEPGVLSERHYPIGHSALGQRVPVVIAPAGSGIDTLSPTFGDHGRRRSPFGLAQEYLNGFEGALWGIVTDGCTLRTLRDNASLTRPAWIEADLARIFTEERYADFAALWLLLHETRFGRDGQPVTECALETWRNAGKEEGTRAREHLRNGVEEALVALGQGFLAHPENKTLRTALQDGSLSTRDYFNQLLRLVYRLIFLLTVEERNLLHPEGTPDAARSLYADGYSLRRLREKALKRSAHDRFADLWQSTKVGFRGLATGEPRLGLPALAGIFATNQCPALDAAKLENRALLLAVFKLAWLRDDGALARVNWRDMGPEELGSVYESLLELVPQISKEGRQFGFASGDETKGNARKTTGSYYTPDSLVQVLLDSALEPVIADTIRGVERVASGEWRVVPENLRAAFVSYANQQLSGSGSLAEGARPGQGSLSAHAQVSQGGALRNDLSNPPGLDLDPGQHSGGLGSPLSSGVHSVSPHGEREPDRAGNSPDPQRGRGIMSAGSGGATASGHGNPGQAASGTGARPATEAELESFWRTLPFAIRHSLLAQQALLSLSIVDPACGSGHFLLAAARRLATHVARLQANGTPSGAQYRHALRQVVGHCIYGVDLNPMAVELCKVSLWMEAVEPGLPLTFLNSHIQHGNALLGTTPELMDKGIPDAAWEPIEGDDRKVASALKKRNKQGATGQRSLDTLWSQPAEAGAQAVAKAVSELDAASDADAAQLANKEAKWEGILESDEYRKQKFVADAWCAAFVWPKNPGPLAEVAPTNELWRQVKDGQGKPPALTATAVQELTAQYSFFHWHLQFPQVFAKGGFDVVLGNPPWDAIQFNEEEFFALEKPEIASAATSSARKKLIAKLERDNPTLFVAFRSALRKVEGINAFVRCGIRYPLCGVGRVNLSALFAETARSLTTDCGSVGQVLPSGIVSEDSTKLFFQKIMENRQLLSFFDFENREAVFGAVHRSFKFGLLVLAQALNTKAAAEFVFFATRIEHLTDPKRRFTLSADDIALLNPVTRTCPIFRWGRDAEITKSIYRRIPILTQSGWDLDLKRLINQSDDSGQFQPAPSVGSLPLYEGKYFNHYDHRWATNDGEEDRAPKNSDRKDPRWTIRPRYWFPGDEARRRFATNWKSSWTLAWRDITNATNERTFISAVVPSLAVPHTAKVIFCGERLVTLMPGLVANLASFGFDFVSRQKIGGSHMSSFITEQLPVVALNAFTQAAPWSSIALLEWVVPRVLELTYTAWDLEAFAQDIGFNDPPFRWESERRFLLRCELDAAFFHLYLPCNADGGWKFLDSESPATRQSLLAASPTPRDAVSYMMDTFPIVRKNDEKAHGEYRTKRVILEIYDAMTEAIRTGRPYQTRLDPPPADPSCCHPADPSPQNSVTRSSSS